MVSKRNPIQLGNDRETDIDNKFDSLLTQRAVFFFHLKIALERLHKSYYQSLSLGVLIFTTYRSIIRLSFIIH